MSKVFTANVFITKSRQAMEQLFFGKNKVTSFKKRLEYLSDKEMDLSFIASPDRNEGILRFEYSFGMGGGDNNSKVLLSMVETSKLLEFVLLDNDPMAKKLSHALEMRKDYSSSQGYTSVDRNGIPVVVAEGKPMFTKEDAEGSIFDNKSKEETLESYLSDLDLTNKYYFAFGAGDDIDNWDGPHAMTLNAATLRNTEGNVRTVDVSFVPNPEVLKVWDRNFEKEMGYGNTVKKFSQVLESKSFHQVIGRFEQKFYKSQSTYDGARGGLAWREYTTNLNSASRVLLRNFIGGVTRHKGNVVVAFPHKLREIKLISDTLPAGNINSRVGSLGIEVLKALGIKYDVVDPRLHDINNLSRLKNDRAAAATAAAAGADYANKLNANLMREGIGRPVIGPPLTPPPVDLELLQETANRKDWRIWLQATQNDSSSSRKLGLAGTTFDERRRSQEGSQRERKFWEIANRIFSNAELAFTRGREWAEIMSGANMDQVLVTGIPTLAPQGPPTSQSNIQLSMFTAPIFDAAYNELLTFRPDGMDPTGNGNSPEYTQRLKEQREREFTKLKTEKAEQFVGKIANLLASWDATSEQYYGGLAATADAESKDKAAKLLGPTLKLSMSVTNKPSNGLIDGFIPLLSPLTKFVEGLSFATRGNGEPEITARPFDFFEETDLRILKLWYDYGIINDPTKSAFVFGDLKSIKDTLYLDRFTTLDKGLGSHRSATWNSATNQYITGLPRPSPKAYSAYRLDFEALFLSVKSSRVSSFESSDNVDDMALAKKGGWDFDGLDIILKHNTENPNVTSLTYSMKNYITSLLSMSIRPGLDRQIIGTTAVAAVRGVAEEVLDSNLLTDLLAGNSGSREQLLVDPKKRMKLAYLLQKAIASNKHPSLNTMKLFDAVSLITVVSTYEKIIRDTNSEATISCSPERFATIRKDIMDRYIRQLFKVQLKTLPFFNHKLFAGKTCGLIGVTGGIVGVNPDVRLLAPYTGSYTIQGWKHVISSSEISTSLYLIREGYDEVDATSVTVLEFVKKELEGELARLRASIAENPDWMTDPEVASMRPLGVPSWVKGESLYSPQYSGDIREMQIRMIEASLKSLEQ